MASDLRSIKSIIERDFRSECVVAESSMKRMRIMAPRYRGSVRLSTCRVWTAEAYAERRQRIRSTPLP